MNFISHIISKLTYSRLSIFIKNIFKKYPNQIIVIALTTFVMMPIFALAMKTGTFLSRDYAFHYGRLDDVYKALKDGQLLPQLDPSTFNGLGFGSLQFYGPLAIYFISIIRIIIPSWIWSMLIFEWLVTCGISLLVCNFVIKLNQKKESNKINHGALIASMFILTSGGVLTNLYHYIAYSGLFSIFFLVLMLVNFYDIIVLNKFRLKQKLLLILSGCGLILGHGITLIISIAFISLFMLLNIRKLLKHLLPLFLCAVIILGLTAWFTLPLMENLNYANFNYNNPIFKSALSWQSGFNQKTVDLSRIIFGQPNVGRIDNPSGFFWVYTILGLFAAYSVTRKVTRDRSFVLSCVIVTFSTIASITRLVNWDYVPSIFYTLQYPTRIMVLTGVFFTIGLSPLLSKIKLSKLSFLLISSMMFMALVSALNPDNYRTGGYSKYIETDPNRVVYDNSLSSPDGQDQLAIGEYLTTNMSKCAGSMNSLVSSAGINTYIVQQKSTSCLLKRGFDIIAPSELIIENSHREGSRFSLNIKHAEDQVVKNKNFGHTSIELPQVYYLGYKAYGKNNEGKKINFHVKESTNGLVSIELPDNYEGVVKTYYGFSKATTIGVAVFFVTSLICASSIIYRYVKVKRPS